ncbi:MAG: S-DNA-T family DNA segregation ATPase FtsK/SpoIIIE [Sphingobacteriales bacterium]
MQQIQQMAPKTNRFKENTASEPKKERKPGRKLNFGNALQFLKKRRFRSITGMMMLLLSIYLFIAFFSYLFTWKIDQSLVAGADWGILFDNLNNKVENWLGLLGAMMSYKLLDQWFGLASFILVYLLSVGSVKLLFKVDLLPPTRNYSVSIFLIFFISTLFGFLVETTGGMPYFTAGAFGVFINGWFNDVVGVLGTGFLLLFVLAGFLYVAFDVTLARIIIGVNKMRGNYEEQSLMDDDEVVPLDNEFQEEAAIIKGDNEDDEEGSLEIAVSELPLEVETPVLEEKEETEKAPEPKETIANDGFDDVMPAPADKSEPEEDANELEVAEVLEEKKSDVRRGSLDEDYDETLDLGTFKLPSVDLLNDHGGNKIKVTPEELEANKNKIVETLGHYNITIAKIKATIGPTVTLYEIIPAAGVRISKIKNLEDDIALSLAALGIRIIAPIPGKGTIGIEVPNQQPEMVSFKSVIETEKFQNSTFDLPIALGKTISNEVFIADLAKMPHLLVAGATGQGKSVGINAILVSLLYKKHPAQLKFVLVDPKKVELSIYRKIERHYLAKLPDEEEAIITDTKKVINTLNSLCIEMDDRYNLLKDGLVRNLKEYNKKFTSRKLNPNEGHRFLPFIVLVIDEFADLMMTAGKEVETPIARLAQLARAVGIHIVLATQRPSVNIITGVIKANFPARLAFRVSSKIDSRTILDSGGADQLIGKGDMLLSMGSDIIRLQCPFVDTPEVDAVIDYIGSQRGYPTAHMLPEYVSEEGDSSKTGVDLSDRDALFNDAASIVVQHQQGSTSLVQRRLKVGYNRAGRIIDQLEAAGIVGPFEGSKAREVLMPDEYALEQHIENLDKKLNN